MVLHFDYSAKIVDVETAFIYGNLQEEINMECPQGMSDLKYDDCIVLNKCIFCLVQAAQQYYKKAVETLESLGFVGGSINPCLYVKKNTKCIVYIALYSDDKLMIGDVATIHDTIEVLKNKGLVLKILEGLQGYLSYKIE